MQSLESSAVPQPVAPPEVPSLTKVDQTARQRVRGSNLPPQPVATPIVPASVPALTSLPSSRASQPFAETETTTDTSSSNRERGFVPFTRSSQASRSNNVVSTPDNNSKEVINEEENSFRSRNPARGRQTVGSSRPEEPRSLPLVSSNRNVNLPTRNVENPSDENTDDRAILPTIRGRERNVQNLPIRGSRPSNIQPIRSSISQQDSVATTEDAISSDVIKTGLDTVTWTPAILKVKYLDLLGYKVQQST